MDDSNEVVVVPKRRNKNLDVAVTQSHSDKVKSVFEFLSSCLLDDIAKLNSIQRTDLFVKLLPYVVPKADNKGDNKDLSSKQQLINCVIENAGIMINKLDK